MTLDITGPGLTAEQRAALIRIVSDWIGEGFTTPPYGDAYYDIFEWLGLAQNDPHGYDTRPNPPVADL